MIENAEPTEPTDLLFAGVDNPDQYIWEEGYANRSFTVQHCHTKLPNGWSVGWKTRFPSMASILEADFANQPSPLALNDFYVWAGYLEPSKPNGASGVYEGIEGYEHDGYVAYFDTFAPALAYALTLTDANARVPQAIATENGWVYPDQIQDIQVLVSKGEPSSYAHQMACNFQPNITLGPRTMPSGIEAEELKLAFILKDGHQMPLYSTVPSVKIVNAEALALPIFVKGRKKPLSIDIRRVQGSRQKSYHRIRYEAESLCQDLVEKFNLQVSLASVDRICNLELVAA